MLRAWATHCLTFWGVLCILFRFSTTEKKHVLWRCQPTSSFVSCLTSAMRLRGLLIRLSLYFFQATYFLRSGMKYADVVAGKRPVNASIPGDAIYITAERKMAQKQAARLSPKIKSRGRQRMRCALYICQSVNSSETTSDLATPSQLNQPWVGYSSHHWSG